jgi:hypothetical protein
LPVVLVPNPTDIYLPVHGRWPPSLDGEYFGKKLGECRERLGDLHAAKYRDGRAIEENPARQDYAAARTRLQDITIDDLVSPRLYAVE